MTRFLSLGEAARLLGVPPHRITYAHSVGSVAEPERVMGKRAYCQGDLARLAKHFGVRLFEPAHIGLREEEYVKQ